MNQVICLRKVMFISNALVFAGVACAIAGQRHSTPHPQSCGGIDVMGSRDQDVTKRYGKGYFVKDESHLGGRYFVDPTHKVTLHTEIGPDNSMDAIDLQQGLHLPGKFNARKLKAAESKAVSDRLAIDNVLHLGATPHEVRARYGKPHSDTQEKGERTFGYTVPGTAESLDYDVNFVFRQGRLIKVSFENAD